jgi:hypothetical protein
MQKTMKRSISIALIPLAIHIHNYDSYRVSALIVRSPLHMMMAKGENHSGGGPSNYAPSSFSNIPRAVSLSPTASSSHPFGESSKQLFSFFTQHDCTCFFVVVLLLFTARILHIRLVWCLI